MKMREDSCDEMEEMLKEQAKVAYRPEPKREAASRGRQQTVGNSSSRTKEKSVEEQLSADGAAIPTTKVEPLQEEEKVVATSEDAKPSSSSAQQSAAATRPRRRGSGGRVALEKFNEINLIVF
jgi:hypothetical protein